MNFYDSHYCNDDTRCRILKFRLPIFWERGEKGEGNFSERYNLSISVIIFLEKFHLAVNGTPSCRVKRLLGVHDLLETFPPSNFLFLYVFVYLSISYLPRYLHLSHYWAIFLAFQRYEWSSPPSIVVPLKKLTILRWTSESTGSFTSWRK